MNSLAVVDDPDPLAAALLDLDVDPSGQCVDAVLQQFLDHARRPLDHLARGDLVDDPGVELLDAGHGGGRLLPASIPCPQTGRCAPLIPAVGAIRNGLVTLGNVSRC